MRSKYLRESIEYGQSWVQGMLNRDQEERLINLAHGTVNDASKAGMHNLGLNFGRMFALFTWAATQEGADYEKLKSVIANLPLRKKRRDEIMASLAEIFHPVSQ
jgi:hypothetical protein